MLGAQDRVPEKQLDLSGRHARGRRHRVAGRNTGLASWCSYRSGIGHWLDHFVATLVTNTATAPSAVTPSRRITQMDYIFAITRHLLLLDIARA